jgi:hypothetical protein
MDDADDDQGATTSRPYDEDIRRIERLSRQLRPSWRSKRRAAKLEVAQKIRRFLREHHGPDDRLGEALAIIAWRKRDRSYPEGAMPTQSTLCRRVLDIPYRRANSLAHALVALDRAHVPVKFTQRVLKRLGGIEATTRASDKEVRRVWKRVEKKLHRKKSSGGGAKKPKKTRSIWT